MKERQHSTISISLAAALSVAALCTTAHAVGFSYQNTTGGTVYELDSPTGWLITGSPGETVLTLAGAGPTGADAYYRSGASGGVDDSTIAYWDFSFAPLPNVGQNLVPGEYKAQMYVSAYGGLAHENDGVFGSGNGPWGYHAMGQFSSWDGVSQAAPGWTDESTWVGGYVWLSNNGWSQGSWNDMEVFAKWNPWGGYGGLAVSGVRISTDGNFTMVPEPSALALGLLGGLALWSRRAKR